MIIRMHSIDASFMVQKGRPRILFPATCDERICFGDVVSFWRSVLTKFFNSRILYRSDSFGVFPNLVVMGSFFVISSFTSATDTWIIRHVTL